MRKDLCRLQGVGYPDGGSRSKVVLEKDGTMHLARIAGVILALLVGCPAASKEKTATSPTTPPMPATKPTGAKPMQPNLADLDSLKAMIGQDQKSFVAQFAIQPQHINNDAVFERLSKLVQIHNPALGGIWFYFQDGKLSVIDWSDSATLQAIDGKALAERLGKGSAWLRSRAGKSHNLRVWADQGVAVSLGGGEVDYIHLFAPMSDHQYEQTLYQDPGPFTR